MIISSRILLILFSISHRLLLLLLCSALPCYVMFHSAPFHSVLFRSVLLRSVLFCSVLFSSVLFCFALVCSDLFCSAVFYSIITSDCFMFLYQQYIFGIAIFIPFLFFLYFSVIFIFTFENTDGLVLY